MGAHFWSYVSSAESWWFTERPAMIPETGGVYPSTQEKENRPQRTTIPEAHHMRAVTEAKTSYCMKWTYTKPLKCNRFTIPLLPEAKLRIERRVWWSTVLKAARRPSTTKQTCCHYPEQTECHLQHVTKLLCISGFEATGAIELICISNFEAMCNIILKDLRQITVWLDQSTLFTKHSGSGTW